MLLSLDNLPHIVPLRWPASGCSSWMTCLTFLPADDLPHIAPLGWFVPHNSPARWLALHCPQWVTYHTLLPRITYLIALLRWLASYCFLRMTWHTFIPSDEQTTHCLLSVLSQYRLNSCFRPQDWKYLVEVEYKLRTRNSMLCHAIAERITLNMCCIWLQIPSVFTHISLKGLAVYASYYLYQAMNFILINMHISSCPCQPCQVFGNNAAVTLLFSLCAHFHYLS